jgi:dipeptidyl aminopeptidase/acylaminoacyl peptidase
VWEIATGKRLASFYHGQDVYTVAFSPDGQYLATASEDKTAGVWEIATEKRLASLSHRHRVSTIVFSPDGKYVATASWDRTARLWLWRPEDLIAEAWTHLTRELTEQERKQYIDDEPARNRDDGERIVYKTQLDSVLTAPYEYPTYINGDCYVTNKRILVRSSQHSSYISDNLPPVFQIKVKDLGGMVNAKGREIEIVERSGPNRYLALVGRTSQQAKQLEAQIRKVRDTH